MPITFHVSSDGCPFCDASHARTSSARSATVAPEAPPATGTMRTGMAASSDTRTSSDQRAQHQCLPARVGLSPRAISACRHEDPPSREISQRVIFRPPPV